MFQKIGFIGTGNMGSAIAKAICPKLCGASVYLSNRSREKAEVLASEIPGAVASDNLSIADGCDLIFLGIKPQVFPQVMEEISPILNTRKDPFLLVSMASGISTRSILSFLNEQTRIIRIMPNTPVSIGKGIIEYCSVNVSSSELADFCELLSDAGLIDSLPESLMDAASALTGCGPAFVYMFIEALSDGAVACGIPRKQAIAYAAAMTEGAAAMVQKSSEHPGTLKDAVCSPGGTTIQGVRTLENGAFRSLAMNAVISAYEKTTGKGE